LQYAGDESVGRVGNAGLIVVGHCQLAADQKHHKVVIRAVETNISRGPFDAVGIATNIRCSEPEGARARNGIARAGVDEYVPQALRSTTGCLDWVATMVASLCLLPIRRRVMVNKSKRASLLRRRRGVYAQVRKWPISEVRHRNLLWRTRPLISKDSKIEICRISVTFSPRVNAPSDQLAPDGRLPGMAAPTPDTQGEVR
jgi:hypothetical protein